MKKSTILKSLVIFMTVLFLVACFGVNIDAKLEDYETALNEGDLNKAEELRAELVKFEDDSTMEFSDDQSIIFAERQVRHFKMACEKGNAEYAQGIYDRFERYQLTPEQQAEVEAAMNKAGFSFVQQEVLDPEQLLNELETAVNEYGDLELAKEIQDKLNTIEEQLTDEQKERLSEFQ